MSIQVDLGDPLPDLAVQVRDENGALADAGDVVLTVTLPDGTTTAPTVTRTSTGVYTAAYTPTVAGRFVAAWVATGANASASSTVYNVSTTVQPIVSLADVRTFLGVNATDNDDLLRHILEAVSDVCERFTKKAWRRQTVTETHSTYDSDYLHLRRVPVVSVSSVTVNGVAFTDYTVDKRAGLLRPGTSIAEYDWQDSFAGITVTYVAGPADGVVPPNIRQGCLLLARHMWDTQRGGSNMPRQLEPSEDYNPALGFYVPNRVRQAWGEPRILVR